MSRQKAVETPKIKILMIARTSVGSVATKSSGTTLVLQNITANIGDLLVVGIGWNGSANLSNNPPPVMWGTGDSLTLAYGSGSLCKEWLFFIPISSFTAGTKNITALWSSSLGARAMFATKITGLAASALDTIGQAVESHGNAINDIGVQTNILDEYFAGLLCVVSSENDPAPTWISGWSAGQRAGTTSSKHDSSPNIYVQEGFKIVSATEVATAAVQGLATTTTLANIGHATFS